MPLLITLSARLQLSLNWVSNYRYSLLVLFLLLQVSAFSLQGIWVEDFWEHSAAVSEFMRNGLNPSHPQLALNAPHTFLNPYSFGVGLLASALHLNAITALALVGVMNFALFCWGLRAFVETQCDGQKQTSKVSFYTLLFILFLWGADPWPYSGFFNFQILLFNLPYPSTFIGGLSLLTLGYVGQRKMGLHAGQWVGLMLVICLALLTHPLTAQFLVVGLSAQAFFVIKNTLPHLLKLFIACAVSVALATLWPFYPFLELLQGAGAVYDLSNGTMYYHFLARVWPFILLSPLIAWTIVQRQHRVLLFIFVSTVAIYIFGLYTQKYSYGRIISYTVMALQICCALMAAKTENLLGKFRWHALMLYQVSLLSILIGLSFLPLQSSINRLLTAANSIRLDRPVFNQVSYKDYSLLQNSISAGSIVFANMDVSWLLPSFGGKVIVSDHPLAFVSDAAQRREDSSLFFSTSTSPSVRTGLLVKYHADYLLLDKRFDQNWEAISQSIYDSARGQKQFENDRFLLITLNKLN